MPAIGKRDIDQVINRDYDPQDPLKAWRDLAFHASTASDSDRNPAFGQAIAILAVGKLLETLHQELDWILKQADPDWRKHVLDGLT